MTDINHRYADRCLHCQYFKTDGSFNGAGFCLKIKKPTNIRMVCNLFEKDKSASFKSDESKEIQRHSV